VSENQGRLLVEGVTHRYGRVTVLNDVTLAVDRGEFVTLLGPSGCGKTTLLRIIAGFVRPKTGRIVLGARDVTHVPPHQRPVNTVFQRPALFPHLDVGENVAFGLRIAGVPARDIARRVAETLALVRLSGFERRRSHELSGGQMQRVALARVLVGRPSVLLLDEPLSALDLAIRLEMEVELRRVHRATGASFIYVTHDQREALALSDRIAVLNQGRIEQIGTPEQIYRSPASPFAARFVGDANVMPVEIAITGEREASLDLGQRRLVVARPMGVAAGPAWLVVRPEAIRLSPGWNSGGQGIHGIVHDVAFRGSGYAYRVAVAGTDDVLKSEAAATTSAPFPIGSRVTITWDASACGILPRNMVNG
jgi:ABC-type Fe3+/spermidine/putrescine transport system ATPase subunit